MVMSWFSIPGEFDDERALVMLRLILGGCGNGRHFVGRQAARPDVQLRCFPERVDEAPELGRRRLQAGIVEG